MFEIAKLLLSPCMSAIDDGIERLKALTCKIYMCKEIGFVHSNLRAVWPSAAVRAPQSTDVRFRSDASKQKETI